MRSTNATVYAHFAVRKKFRCIRKRIRECWKEERGKGRKDGRKGGRWAVSPRTGWLLVDPVLPPPSAYGGTAGTGQR